MTTSPLPTPHRAPADVPDASLVHAAQQGDTRAFAVLVQQHAASLRAVAIATLGYVDEVDDAVQDALLVALRTLPQLRDPDAAGPWLRSIVRTSCLMLVRTRRATPVAEPELLLPADPALEPAAVLERAATGDWVQQAVSELAGPIREVVVLRYFSDWSSYRQIAQLCGVPEDTVRSRLRDGRRALAGALQRSATAAHADAGRAAELSRGQAEETIAASLGDDYEQVLHERYHRDATVVLPGRPPAGRSSLLTAGPHPGRRRRAPAAARSGEPGPHAVGDRLPQPTGLPRPLPAGDGLVAHRARRPDHPAPARLPGACGRVSPASHRRPRTTGTRAASPSGDRRRPAGPDEEETP